jgi:hypothetical protein
MQAAAASDDLEIALYGRRSGVEDGLEPQRENQRSPIGDLDDEQARAADRVNGRGGDAGLVLHAT